MTNNFCLKEIKKEFNINQNPESVISSRLTMV